MADRQSQSGGIELITDKSEKTLVEAENALRQTRAAMALLPNFKSSLKPRLKASLFLGLHRILMNRISPYPGTYRATEMTISHSNHKPPPPSDVPRLIEDLCDYVNENWESKSAIHLSAYVLWRTNWIHPFEDGNGRTARIVSYLVLCAHAKIELPGVFTIPEQIANAKQPYYKALEDADSHFRTGNIDVSVLEILLESCLARQLVEFYKSAGGRTEEIDVSTRREIEEAISAAQTEGVLVRDANPQKIRKHKIGIVEIIEKRPVLYGGILAIILFILGILFAK